MVFTRDGIDQVAIERWPEWDLNPRPLNPPQPVQPTELPGHELTHTQSQLSTATPISSFVPCHISFGLFAFVSHHVCLIVVFSR